jgi:hypothetical protein
VFSKSTLIALLDALADDDALENIVRNGKIYKTALPGENPVRARQSYRAEGEI